MAENNETEVLSCSWYDPSCQLSWIGDELQSFGLWIYDSILSGLATAFEALPVPDFLLNISSFALPSSVTWVAAPFQIDVGIGIIVSAYTARFILRRIPGIG